LDEARVCIGIDNAYFVLLFFGDDSSRIVLCISRFPSKSFSKSYHW